MLLKDTNYSAEQIVELVKKYMIETYVRFDFVAETAKDMYMFAPDGREYLDFYGGVAVNNVGNVNEAVVKAVQEQAGQLMQTFNYPYTIPQAVLAEKVCTELGFDKIFYQNSGTEANEAMIKMARKYGVENFHDKRYKIITAKKSFHGRTYGALSATGQPDNANQIGYFPVIEGFTYAELNNLQSFKDATDDDTIAIMIEPVQGEGGVWPCDPEFVKGLREWCDEKDMLLLFDEIQTGWGRTGKLMAFMHYDVKPDIVSMAKGMGGGMPIGAIVTSDKVGATFNAGSHGSTFGGHPVCCAAAYAAVNEIIDKKLSENAEEVGNYFREEAKKLPHVVDVRGKGMLNGIEFDKNVLELKGKLVEKGLLVTVIGTNIIRAIPPLTATKEHVDKALEIIREVVA